jgi:hypothetical protein
MMDTIELAWPSATYLNMRSAHLPCCERAEYGEEIVSTLSRQLEIDYGKGFSIKAPERTAPAETPQSDHFSQKMAGKPRNRCS